MVRLPGLHAHMLITINTRERERYIHIYISNTALADIMRTRRIDPDFLDDFVKIHHTYLYSLLCSLPSLEPEPKPYFDVATRCRA